MGGGRLECSNENIEKRGVQGYKPFYSQWSRHVCSQGELVVKGSQRRW